MADTKSETPEKKAAPAAKEGEKDKKKPLRGKPRNYDLGNGVYRFSRTRMYHKKAIYKFLGKKTPKKVMLFVYYLLINMQAKILNYNIVQDYFCVRY